MDEADPIFRGLICHPAVWEFIILKNYTSFFAFLFKALTKQNMTTKVLDYI